VRQKTTISRREDEGARLADGFGRRRVAVVTQGPARSLDRRR
jgi:hypothetical protein